MKIDDALETIAALEFLDRHQGEWYCTMCWARAAGVEMGLVERLALTMMTDDAVAAGYQAWMGGKCLSHDGVEPSRKRLRTVRSLGKQEMKAQ